MAELKNLIVEGDSRLIGDTKVGKVTATSFVKDGGTSGQFLKADGTVDSNTYAKTSQLPSVSNATITVKQTGRNDQTFTLNGSATTINLDNTTYSNATQTAAGLMSFTDKAKLDSCASSSNNANVGYDSTNKKITKTINGTTSDVVTVATLKTAMNLAKGDVGLGNVTNDSQVKRSEMGVASGVATLDSAGKVPQSQLPSYVDDVLEYSSTSAFPTTGETGKIYVALDTNKTYRWGGSSYVVISETLSLGETSSTAYRGDRGKTAYDHASAKGSAFASGLYKITTNSEGHVTAATTVAKADITALGIPGSDTNTTYTLANGTGTDANKLIFTPSSGTATKLTVDYASTAGSAAAAPWAGITDKPTKLSQFTNDVVNNSTITIKQTGISDQTFTLNGSAKTITLADNNTWRPLGTGANDACAGNDSRLSDARPASDVYSWAKQSTKPSYTLDEVADGSTRKLANYLPTAGGWMTGTIKYTGTTCEIIRTGGDDTSWRGGLKYSWSSNTTIALWGKHTKSQFVWHAGSDFSSSDVNGTTTRTYDFQVGRNGSNVLEGLIGGNLILHAGNYTSYAPSLTGTGASGTWGISVSGNAATASSVAWANVTGKPTIPTVNNATLTIQKNGTAVKTFTANASTDVTCNITVPTKTSELSNDSGYITGYTDNKTLQTVTTSSNTSWRPLIIGDSYSDAATFAPATTTAGTYSTHLAKFAPSTGVLAIVGLNKMNTNGTTATGSNSAVFNTNGGTTTLASVATSGSYNDLSNKPTIPTVNNGALSIYGVETKVATFEANQSGTSNVVFQAGNNVTITPSVSSGTGIISIAATDTTYSSKTAASGGTDVSLCTTGEKYTWNNKGTYSKPSGGIPKTDLASAVQTSLGKADTALQSHKYRGISVNGQVKLTDTDATYLEFKGGGLVDTTYDDVDGLIISGPSKVTSVSSSSTDNQVPTAKCLYTMVGNIESLLAALR